MDCRMSLSVSWMGNARNVGTEREFSYLLHCERRGHIPWAMLEIQLWIQLRQEASECLWLQIHQTMPHSHSSVRSRIQKLCSCTFLYMKYPSLGDQLKGEACSQLYALLSSLYLDFFIFLLINPIMKTKKIWISFGKKYRNLRLLTSEIFFEFMTFFSPLLIPLLRRNLIHFFWKPTLKMNSHNTKLQKCKAFTWSQHMYLIGNSELEWTMLFCNDASHNLMFCNDASHV